MLAECDIIDYSCFDSPHRTHRPFICILLKNQWANYSLYLLYSFVWTAKSQQKTGRAAKNKFPAANP